MMKNPRFIVLTDIFYGFEVDDIQSMIRLLLYANEIDIAGLIACTSCFVKKSGEHNAAIIRRLIKAYGEVKPNLDVHKSGYPSPDSLLAVTCAGIPEFGRRPGKGFAHPRYADNAGVRLIVDAALKDDDRPLHIALWGGANTLAQAVWQVSRERTASELGRFLSKLRIYGISDQDHAARWLRDNFGDRLFYIVSPSKGSWFGNWQYWRAAWPGISSDNFKHGSEDGTRTRGFTGADAHLVSPAWIAANIIAKGPLGALYPQSTYIMEGDTPTFLGLIANGLNDPARPDYGGWGGRYCFYRPTVRQCARKEKFPIWTNASDRVVGDDGREHVSPQATIWRWRAAFQHDMAARMDWTMQSVYENANHNPVVTAHGRLRTAAPGERVVLHASASDPHGGVCDCKWFVYREAGTYDGEIILSESDGGVSFSAPAYGAVHVIFEATNRGKPPLTAYARFIVNVAEKSPIN